MAADSHWPAILLIRDRIPSRSLSSMSEYATAPASAGYEVWELRDFISIIFGLENSTVICFMFFVTASVCNLFLF